MLIKSKKFQKACHKIIQKQLWMSIVKKHLKKERSISPEKRQEIHDELRLKLYENEK